MPNDKDKPTPRNDGPQLQRPDETAALRAEIERLREANDALAAQGRRLEGDLTQERRGSVELRRTLDEYQVEVEQYRKLGERLRTKTAAPVREELREGNVWAYTKLRYVIEESVPGQGWKPRVVPPGELIQVPARAFECDQAHRFPHLESEAEHDKRVAEQKQRHVATVDGELQQILAGFALAEEMRAVRAQQQQVTAQQLVDAQRLGSQMPQGPLPQR